ncbi:MAG: hypothetical protein CL670_12540 [Balneola sp.]|jgi:excisionase family DNA binding protein|nr:hypothetical protein [Balneola sp.]MBE79975.1 hypothetical protein [Balneola sp.]|tara:strand:+ start:1103 stop:1384 length:282 start_codon:yes stop_codon:yes gene_type:complete
MKVIVTSEEELQEMINRAVEKTFKELLPKAIREASRKEWLNTDDVMEYLGCSRRTIQYLRDERRISFTQDGRKILYHIDDVNEYLEKGKVRRW